MSIGIPALPKKQIRDPEEGESENDEEPILQEEDDETGDESSNAGGDDSSSSIAADTSDESDDDVAAGADSSDEGGDIESGAAGAAEATAVDSDDETEVSSKKKKKRTTKSSKKNMDDDMTLLGVPHGIHFEDDDDEEGEDDEDADKDSSEYFQKLKSSVRESYVEMYHPESMAHNYDEIQTLARVVRNSAGVIVDDLHRTIPIMTKYEKTRILGQRTKQINEGAPIFIKIDSTVIDGYLIAVKELEQKKTPFIIRRPLPNGGSEYWRVQDLEIL
jgi:DNA-directed RNA polymerase subunit K/omega